MTDARLKLRLYAMMFLQYSVQGAYLPILTVYARDTLYFGSQQLGQFAAAVFIGPLLAPLLIGQIVDRHIPTQYVLAFCHAAAALTMFALASQQSFGPAIALAALYSILYVPTMMLTNAVAFSHLKEREREFPTVRVWGTIGFILPAWCIEPFFLAGLTGDELNRARVVAFWISGALGLAMALYSFSLPHTPPQRRGSFAPSRILSMLRERNFLVLVTVTFFIAMVHNYHFVWNGPFLRSALSAAQIEGAYEQRISSLGQISEIGVMFLLGLMVVRLGFKMTLLIGSLAYLARCTLFALAAWSGPPVELPLAIAAQTLHGFCFGCFLATAFMYVDRVAPPDARGSMQTLFGTFVFGSGAVLGAIGGGAIGKFFSQTVAGKEVNDFTSIWLVGAALAAVCAAALAALFSAAESSPRRFDTGPDVT
jgi:nucleoside transporter